MQDAGTRDAECRVKLWWRAEADMPESYKVFVHLLDANGVPRAQADVIPVNGTRPTTSWLPGEIIADESCAEDSGGFTGGHSIA